VPAADPCGKNLTENGRRFLTVSFEDCAEIL
jgi:hypothetical protein